MVRCKLRVAVIGNAESIYTMNYIKYVALPLNQEVHLITARNNQYASFYQANGVEVHCTYNRHKLSHNIPKIKWIAMQRDFERRIRAIDPDVIQVHYSSVSVLESLANLNVDAKLVLVYWGSDLLREDDRSLLSVKNIIEKADRFVFATKEMKEKFRCVYGSGHDKKLAIIHMGVSVLKHIDDILAGKQEVKERLLGIVNGRKIVVAIGYNGKKAQQHIKIIETLGGLDDDVKQKCHLLIPMTYGVEDQEYIYKVADYAEKCGISHTLLTDFMNEEESAMVRVSSDVFIHAQPTDARAASFLEHLYAGSIVLNGGWLHYDDLTQIGIEYGSFDKIEDLAAKVSGIVRNWPPSHSKNHSLMQGLFGWDDCRSKWEQVFLDL